MAEGKRSFIIYSDLMQNIDHLTNEEKGQLFTHLLEYVNDLNPILEDRVLLSVWKPIERQLKRDLVKYSGVKEVRSLAGKKSAEIRAAKKAQQNSTNLTSVETVQQSSTNPTVSVNDNVTVNVNDNVILLKKETKEIVRFKPPTLLEIKNYCIEHNKPIEYEVFFNFYQSNGWKVGKNKMKDWKAAAVGWHTRDKGKKQPVAKRTGKDVFLETFYNTEE
jgi:hypothetical protein